jgi:ADP-ribose pyrophosphatase
MADPREELLQKIRFHAAVDANERSHRDAMLRLLEAGDSFSRSHFAPGHFTASAFITDAMSHRVLLHHHRRLGRWLEMGGHVDSGETIEQAALREAREESGLEDLRLDGGILDLDVHPIPAGKGEPPHHHFDVRFLVLTKTPDAIELDPNESLDLAWFTIDEAIERTNAPESTRALEKIRERLRGMS